MVNAISRDKKRRFLYKKYEIKRNILKAMIRDLSISKELRFQFTQELGNLPRNSSIVRTKNRCIQTGRAKSNYRFFKISRITFRELASKGLLPGITKSSW
jgi:small subunit ribosomal protein S14